MTTIKNVTEKKKSKNLVRLLSANKIDNCNRGKGKEKKKKKNFRKNLQNRSKNKNNKCFS